MNLRRTRFLLWTATTVMCGSAVAAVVWAICPLQLLDNAGPAQSSVSSAPAVETEPKDLTHDLKQVAQVDLRRPLHDPPPVIASAPAAKPPPPLDIRLSGTIFEPGHCRAMIQFPDGSVQLKAVGETAGQARIIDIQSRNVTVEFLGKPVILTVPKPEGS